MLRRKLALYTLLYIAGITAGFFMLERARALEASGFAAAVIAVAVFADLPDTAQYSFRRETRNQTDHSDKHLNIGKEAIRTQKTILAITNDEQLAKSTVRISLSHLTTNEELDVLINTINNI